MAKPVIDDICYPYPTIIRLGNYTKEVSSVEEEYRALMEMIKQISKDYGKNYN